MPGALAPGAPAAHAGLPKDDLRDDASDEDDDRRDGDAFSPSGDSHVRNVLCLRPIAKDLVAPVQQGQPLAELFAVVPAA